MNTPQAKRIFPDFFHFPDFSLTIVKFPDFSRFSRLVATLCGALVNTEQNFKRQQHHKRQNCKMTFVNMNFKKTRRNINGNFSTEKWQSQVQRQQR